MSRIGKQAIIISDKIIINIENNVVTVQGPKGEESQNISSLINLTMETIHNKKLLYLRMKNKSKQSQALYGLSRTLIDNMITGVTKGFSKYLEIQGVGYRSQMDAGKLILHVGYSHPVIINPPNNVFIEVENNTNISIFGTNKEIVGQLASTIRRIRPPEPYKGKGIRYKGEIVKKKVGKAGK